MSFFGDIFSGKAQYEASKFNASVIERNAKMDEMRAEQIMSVHNNYSLPRFDKSVEQIQGKTTTAYLSNSDSCPFENPTAPIVFALVSTPKFFTLWENSWISIFIILLI